MTLARVVEREPDLDALPPAFRRGSSGAAAVSGKDPKQRLSDIRDVRLALEGAFESVAPHTTATATALTHERHVWMAAFAVAVVGMIALGVPALRHVRETPPEESSLQLSVPLPANSTTRFLEMSPDGRRLLVERSSGRENQTLGPIAGFADSQPLSGTDRRERPSGRRIAVSLGFSGTAHSK